jgi:hypothetical protein
VVGAGVVEVVGSGVVEEVVGCGVVEVVGCGCCGVGCRGQITSRVELQTKYNSSTTIGMV